MNKGTRELLTQYRRYFKGRRIRAQLDALETFLQHNPDVEIQEGATLCTSSRNLIVRLTQDNKPIEDPEHREVDVAVMPRGDIARSPEENKQLKDPQRLVLAINPEVWRREQGKRDKDVLLRTFDIEEEIAPASHVPDFITRYGHRMCGDNVTTSFVFLSQSGAVQPSQGQPQPVEVTSDEDIPF